MMRWNCAPAVLALASIAGLACSEANEIQEATTPDQEATVVEVEPAPARPTGEIWLDILADWEELKRLDALERKSQESMGEMDTLVRSLDRHGIELLESVDLEGTELIVFKRSVQVLQASLFQLAKITEAQVPGRLPEAMKFVHAQLWVVQEKFPEGSLPGEPIEQPQGIR